MDDFERIMRIGEARAVLKNFLLDEELFSDTSKYNSFFHSEHAKEEEKLHQLRWFVIRVQEHLLHALDLIESNDDLC